MEQVDAGLARTLLYVAAIAAGWKAYRVANVLLGLDSRMTRMERRQVRIEAHLGMPPLVEDEET